MANGKGKNFLVGTFASRATAQRFSLRRRRGSHSAPRKRSDSRAAGRGLGVAGRARRQARRGLRRGCERSAVPAAGAPGTRRIVPLMGYLLDANAVIGLLKDVTSRLAKRARRE